MIADENPHYFDAFIDLENNFSKIKTTEEKGARIIYRGFRTAHEVKYNLKLPLKLQDIDECAEECGSVLSDYESIKINNEKNLMDFI